MRKNSYWKHEDSTDMVIEPLRIIYLEGRIKVKAALFTCAYPDHKPDGLLYQDHAEWVITDEELKKWKPWTKQT